MAFFWEKKGDLLLQEGPYFTGRLGPMGPILLVDWGLVPHFRGEGGHLHWKVLLSLAVHGMNESPSPDHGMHSTLLWCTLLTHTHFVYYAFLTLVILFIVPIAVYSEYTLLTKGVHSV